MKDCVKSRSESSNTALYDYPDYYELAFSFRDISQEVTCIEQLIERYAKASVLRVLELACGPSPHLQELCRRGYEYHGLDLSENMLAAGRKKVSECAWRAVFHRASMIDFNLHTTYQFAFVALGSLYARNTEELSTHFQSVARALEPGGLYLLDWCVQFGQSPAIIEDSQSWRMERDGIAVKVNVILRDVDPVEQIVQEETTLNVSDRGQTLTISNCDLRRVIYPQEFHLLIDAMEEFEFVGWWNDWDLNQPLSQVTGEINRPIVAVRRV
ncbi:MAG: class I SAM-dependent methyltransferase [Candidatus Poribacteria bacterium]|nr:class I SAM-dependent methyltransferase [Candidatus Poribacteria bacterium]